MSPAWPKNKAMSAGVALDAAETAALKKISPRRMPSHRMSVADAMLFIESKI
jgi:hypothetical protein